MYAYGSFLLTCTSGAFTAEADDSCAGGFSPKFRVSGQVTNPKTYYLSDSRSYQLPGCTTCLYRERAFPGTFTGVLLWDLIEAPLWTLILTSLMISSAITFSLPLVIALKRYIP